MQQQDSNCYLLLTDAITLLLEEGVNGSVMDNSGITPLHCSVANDAPNCSAELLQKTKCVNPVMRTKDVSFSRYTFIKFMLDFHKVYVTLYFKPVESLCNTLL